MDANTVTITLKDYFDLLKIKESDGVYFRGNYHTLYGADRVEKELIRQIFDCNRYIDSLKKIIAEKDEKLNQPFYKRIFKKAI